MRNLKLVSAMATAALLAACGGGGSSTQGTTGGNGAGGGSAGANAPITSTLSGTVLDLGGNPVAGVTVSVFHHNDHTTLSAVTDANGHYAVAGLATGANSDYAIYVAKSGYGFYPAVNDVAGTVDRFDFNGLYRTVIHFPTMPTRDVTGANFTAYGPADHMASLPRTGQATSYASGDDFAQHTGVAWPATRFTDNLDGTVTDHLTGLVWLKNAGCFAAADWSAALASAAQLASGACGLSDGSTAGQWRMPNVNELESLVDVSQFNPALSAAHPFTNVDLAHAYWSSTTYMAGQANAMAIRFGDGRWINGIDPAATQFDNAKTTSANALWAVRSGAAGAIQVLATGVYHGIGGDQASDAGTDGRLQLGAPLTSPRFIDGGDGTLHDTVTGLTWLKQADCIAQPWAGALTAVHALASGQCSLADGSTAGQWRLPNRNELLSLSDRAPTFPQASYFNGQAQASSAVTGPVVFQNFIVSDYYWTSTTDAADTSEAWAIYSCDFGVYNLAKGEVHYALAVR
jgi:hypothetical protein